MKSNILFLLFLLTLGYAPLSKAYFKNKTSVKKDTALGHPYKKKLQERRLLAQNGSQASLDQLAKQPPASPVATTSATSLTPPALLAEIPQAPTPEEIELETRAKKLEQYRLEHPQEALMPAKALNNTDKTVEVNLDKVDLTNLLLWIESIFEVRFLVPDALKPIPEKLGKLNGNVISYKTNRPLTKQQTWDLFLKFLNLFNLTAIADSFSQTGHPLSFTIMSSETAKRVALPAYVGVNWQSLPNNDTKIRYVYFVENTQAATLYNVALDMVSKSAALTKYDPLNAIIFTDISSNIRSIMAILSELDSVSMPEMLSVLRLKHANAKEVKDLFNSLVSTEAGGRDNVSARIFGQQRKLPTAIYFPENTRIIAEERTNSLIILGTKEAIHKVEDFIINYVDTELKQPYSPLYVYELEYANADNIVSILNQVTKFDPDSPAAQYGGVRDGDKFFRPMQFIAEQSGNRILIKAEKEDYLKVRDIIAQLDVKQPQVAIEVLIVNVSASKQKELGTQMRNKREDSLTRNVQFQTSGITNANGNTGQAGTASANTGIITNNSTGSLMGNLVQLAQGQIPGSTLISLGSNLIGGVWALFKALETYVYTNVVSHPFLTTTNKYTAQVSLGSIRRVATGTVSGAAGPTTNVQGDVTANLSVKITPQINTIGIVTLDIEIAIESFTDTDPTNANKSSKTIKTKSAIANGEILAIGGLLQTTDNDVVSKVPGLGNVPILGWFFKDKLEQREKDNLLIFICPQIVEPLPGGGLSAYSKDKACYSKAQIAATRTTTETRDPIHRWFFQNTAAQNMEIVDNFIQGVSACNVPTENFWGTDLGGCVQPTHCPPASYNCPLTGQTYRPVASNEDVGSKRSKKKSVFEYLPDTQPTGAVT